MTRRFWIALAFFVLLVVAGVLLARMTSLPDDRGYDASEDAGGYDGVSPTAP